jgi:hypothetical protein
MEKYKHFTRMILCKSYYIMQHLKNTRSPYTTRKNYFPTWGVVYIFGVVILKEKLFLNCSYTYNDNVGRYTSCMELFKGLNILPMLCMCMREMVCYENKCRKLNNIQVHNYNTWQRLDVQFCRCSVHRI